MKKILNQIFTREKLWRCIFIAVIPAALFYGFSLLGLRSRGFAIMEILRDTAQQNDVSSFIGFLSNIGVWLWVSSVAICSFTVLTSDFLTDKKRRELLILSGILSFFLAVDDFFMIHDRYINQDYCYLAYAILTSALLIRHYKTILEIEGFAFLLAGLLLASSILTDLTQSYNPLSYHHVQVFEEGFKFIGAATWLYYISRVASFRPVTFVES